MMHSSTAGRIDAGARDGFAHDQRAELGRGEVLERAEELAGRRADGGDDDASFILRAVAVAVRVFAVRGSQFAQRFSEPGCLTARRITRLIS